MRYQRDDEYGGTVRQWDADGMDGTAYRHLYFDRRFVASTDGVLAAVQELFERMALMGDSQAVWLMRHSPTLEREVDFLTELKCAKVFCRFSARVARRGAVARVKDD